MNIWKLNQKLWTNLFFRFINHTKMSFSRSPMNASVNQGHTGRQGLVLQCLGQCDVNVVDEIIRLSPVVSVWLFLDNKYHVRRQPHAFLVTFARVRQFCSLNNQINWEYTCTVNVYGTKKSSIGSYRLVQLNIEQTRFPARLHRNLDRTLLIKQITVHLTPLPRECHRFVNSLIISEVYNLFVKFLNLNELK